MAQKRLTDEQRELVVRFMPYVRSLIYREWQQSDKQLQADLVQQGYLALMDAALRYRPDDYPTTTFIGYAKWRVRKYIQEYVKMDMTIRPPWRIIKGKEKPEVVANQPLRSDDDLGMDVLNLYGQEEIGFNQIEEQSVAEWLQTTLDSHSPEIKAWYLQWQAGTLDWSEVSDEDQELLFLLDSEIDSGT